MLDILKIYFHGCEISAETPLNVQYHNKQKTKLKNLGFYNLTAYSYRELDETFHFPTLKAFTSLNCFGRGHGSPCQNGFTAFNDRPRTFGFDVR